MTLQIQKQQVGFTRLIAILFLEQLEVFLVQSWSLQIIQHPSVNGELFGVTVNTEQGHGVRIEADGDMSS